MRGEMGIKKLSMVKALLDSIVLHVDLEEYSGVSHYTLVNHYNDFQYEVNSLL